MSIVELTVVSSAVALLGATGCITGACACDPAYAEALVYGVVRTPEAAPVVGARVSSHADRIGRSCAYRDLLLDTKTTDAQGRFRLGAADFAEPDSVCVFVQVHAPAGSGLMDTLVGPIIVRPRFTAPIDSVQRDIVLRRAS
jgi:hypothetical protein